VLLSLNKVLKDAVMEKKLIGWSLDKLEASVQERDAGSDSDDDSDHASDRPAPV
jgi:hypothetical protein